MIDRLLKAVTDECFQFSRFRILEQTGVTRLPYQAIVDVKNLIRSEEHTSELQSLMRISYAVFCLKKQRTERTEDLKPRTGTRRRDTRQPTKQTQPHTSRTI